MGQSHSKTLTRLKKGVSLAGFVVFIAGLHWFWQLRDIWPRAASDPVPHSVLEAIAVVIVGLYLISKMR